MRAGEPDIVEQDPEETSASRASSGAAPRGAVRVTLLAAAALAAALQAPAAHAAGPAQAAPAPAHVILEGVLADPAFPAGGPEGSVRLEVLETGDTAAVTPGRPFRVRLPVDTLWNLCFKGGPAAAPAGDTTAASAAPDSAAPAADSAAALEKCYEVRHAGADTLLRATLGGGPATVIVAPVLPAASQAAAGGDEQAPEDSGDGTFRPEDAVQLKKVVVRAQRAPKRSLGKSTVSAKLIKRMPGLAEADVIRSIQALPGVVASSDFSTKIYVRGGGADQNLILLDNAVVYSPVHFFGLFSTFLVEGIDEVNFYKGGFPPEYGNRLSSVLDIRSRKGGKDTADSWFKGSSVKISTFAAQAHTEGRQGPFRWLLAGRRTYIDQVLTALRRVDATEVDLPYAFYDLQGSAAYDLGERGSVLSSFYQGSDELTFGVFSVDWGNTVIPLNLELRLDKDWTSRSSASYSLFRQSFGLSEIFAVYNRITTSNFKQVFEYTGLESHRLSFGADINWMETTFAQSFGKIRQEDDAGFWLGSLFLQDRWTLGEAEWTAGARLTQSSLLDEPTVEPRLSLKYRLPHNQSLDLHAGWYAQYVNSIQFADQESLNEFYYPARNLPYNDVVPTTSLLFSAGYGVERIRGQWDFSLEGYYKTLNHLLVFAPDELPDSLRDRSDIRLGNMFKEAQGYSLGFEVSLRRPEGLLFGGISYSNGTSVAREDGTGFAYFPRWHQPHSMKADLAINWRGKDGLWPGKKPGRYLRTSSQLKYSTGLPYTPEVGYMPSHLLEESPGAGAGGPNPEFDRNLRTFKGGRNSAVVPAYLRWDAKVIDWGRENKWNFSWTILNLTNHPNIFFYFYDRSTNPPSRVEITQFPFFPLLVNYEYYF